MFKVTYSDDHEGYVFAREIVPVFANLIDGYEFYTNDIKSWQSMMEIYNPSDKASSPIYSGFLNGNLYFSPDEDSAVQFRDSGVYEVKAYAQSGSWYYVKLTDMDRSGWVLKRDIVVPKEIKNKSSR